MDQQTNVLVRDAEGPMDREAEPRFAASGREVERLRDSLQEKGWGPSLSLSQGIERPPGHREADGARDQALCSVRKAPGSAAGDHLVRGPSLAPGLPRTEMEESWRARAWRSCVSRQHREGCAIRRRQWPPRSIASWKGCSRIGRERSTPAGARPRG